MARYTHTDPEAVRIDNSGRAATAALVDTRWQPMEPRFRAQPLAQGFVLTRQIWRVQPTGAPPERLVPAADDALHGMLGDILEEIVELANPENRTHVAIPLPWAAGL